jgi:hypothetical protein
MRFSFVLALIIGAVIGVLADSIWWALLTVPIMIVIELGVIFVRTVRVQMMRDEVAAAVVDAAGRMKWDIGLPGTAMNVIEVGFRLDRSYGIREWTKTKVFAMDLYDRIRKQLDPQLTELKFVSLARVGQRMAEDGTEMDVVVAQTAVDKMLSCSDEELRQKVSSRAVS